MPTGLILLYVAHMGLYYFECSHSVYCIMTSTNVVLLCLLVRLTKTPTWSQKPSRVEPMALTPPPTCQLRDSSSRRHPEYSGVLFAMQHSVQHKKKLGEKERERERECERN